MATVEGFHRPGLVDPTDAPMAHASTITPEALRRLPIFSSLDASSVGQMVETGRILQLKPQQRTSGLARDASGESYRFVLSGQVAIVLDRGTGGGPAASTQATKVDREAWEFVGAFDRGDFFSDGYMDVVPLRTAGTAASARPLPVQKRRRGKKTSRREPCRSRTIFRGASCSGKHSRSTRHALAARPRCA
jgi:hypothetical protein